MNHKRKLIWVGTACFLVAAAFSVSAQQYEIVDLGTLGGSSSRAAAITENGIISGWATLPFSGKHAVIWDASGIVDLGTPPEFIVSGAAAANDSGQVAANGEGSPQSYRGYLWESGSWTPIGVLPGTNESSASDIDSGGRIVGRSFVLGGEYRAVMWDAGILTDLGTLGGNSSAHAINELGQVVGYSYVNLPGGGQEQRGVVWENGQMTALDPLPDHTGSSASDINEVGQVCGSSSQFLPPYFTTTHACVWDNGTVTALGSVPGYGRTSAADINNHGQVVGTGAASLSGGPYIAFIWQDGVIQNLNDLVPSGTDWDLQRATGINDAGQIVGYGLRSPDDQYLRAFLLEPLVPCNVDSQCDDGLFCNGVEVCESGVCSDGSNPCPGQTCDEGMDMCEPSTCNFDGFCNLGENCNSCPDDCISNDGSQTCGDGICQPSNGEDCLSCASDCRGKQNGSPSKRFCCGADVGCTDARCNGDTWICDDTQPFPYCCGDDACDPGENQCNCPVDCGTPPFTEANCTDGVDNDCDSLTDEADPDCCGQTGDVCYTDADCCSGNCKKRNKFPYLGTCR
jgi:probable HAF family extracellular repeat protein